MWSEGNTPASADEGAPSRPRISEEALRTAHIERGADREVRTPGVRPDRDGLRAAYLGLLKLALCDLAGARTQSVSRVGNGRNPSSQVFSRELTEDEIALRVRGADWPFSGLSMIGLPRLDDLQSCVESVVADGVDGDLIEAGAWRGGASILMRATLDSLGEDGRTVWVADSFQGLPPPNGEAFPQDRELDLSHVDFLAVPLKEVQGYFARFGCERGVEFVAGFFHRDAAGPAGTSVVGCSPRRRHLRIDLACAGGALPEPVPRRLRDHRRLPADRGVPPGGGRVPAAARDHGADRGDRLERRPLAACDRAAGRR